MRITKTTCGLQPKLQMRKRITVYMTILFINYLIYMLINCLLAIKELFCLMDEVMS